MLNCIETNRVISFYLVQYLVEGGEVIPTSIKPFLVINVYCLYVPIMAQIETTKNIGSV